MADCGYRSGRMASGLKERRELVESIPPADFSALLDWLAPRAARGTVVRTVAEVIGDRAP